MRRPLLGLNLIADITLYLGDKGEDASPCDLPDCEAVAAHAALARRVGASVVHCWAVFLIPDL